MFDTCDTSKNRILFFVLSPRDCVDEGELEQGREDEDGAHEEPNVQEFDVAHFGQVRVAGVVSERDECQPSGCACE